MLTVLMMMVMVSGRVKRFLGGIPDLITDTTMRKWERLGVLMLSRLWGMDVGLSGLRHIGIWKEDYLLFVLRDVPGWCVQLLGVVIKMHMSFVGCVGSMLIFWIFERW